MILKRTRFLYTEYNNEELYENQLDINGILNSGDNHSNLVGTVLFSLST
jgi:hypothetical protein